CRASTCVQTRWPPCTATTSANKTTSDTSPSSPPWGSGDLSETPGTESPMGRKIPTTQAIRSLRDAGVTFEAHTYRYEPRGGTAVSSRELGVDEHIVIKTLVFEDDANNPLI